MISSLAGNKTRAVAWTPPPDSTPTSSLSVSAAIKDQAPNPATDRSTSNTSGKTTPSHNARRLPDNRIQQPLMNLPYPFKLSFSGKPFVEAVGTELLGQSSPGLDDLSERFMRALLVPIIDELAVHDQVVQDTNQRLECHIASKHIPVVL